MYISNKTFSFSIVCRMKAVIFDFNGTLFWDTPKHVAAWKKMSEKLRGTPFTHEEDLLLTGRTNKQLIEYCLKREPTQEEVDKIAAEKESEYRQMCIAERHSCHLADGAIDLFEYMKAHNIPFTIATSSEINNVKFFIEFFELAKWFDTSKIVYDQFKYPGKPHPDIYLEAAKTIGVEPKYCIVFEDTESGIKAARAAGIGQIYAIDSIGNGEKLSKLEGLTGVLKDFNEFDRSNLIN